jgi:TolA-binding protein
MIVNRSFSLAVKDLTGIICHREKFSFKKIQKRVNFKRQGLLQDEGMANHIKDNLMRTGCFVKICPLKKFFKFLTMSIVLVLFLANSAEAQALLDQEKATTYLRWNLFTGRDQLQFNKVGNKVVIKTLNPQVFNSLKDELTSIKLDPMYLAAIDFKENSNGAGAINAMAIEIELKGENVEMFSFYRERDKKYVVDFWMDGDSISVNRSAVLKPEAKSPEPATVEKASEASSSIVIADKSKAEPNIIAAKSKMTTSVTAPSVKKDANSVVEKKIEADKDLSSFIVDPSRILKKSQAELDAEAESSKKPYRDFRYGATFIWDYDPIAPVYKQIVNLKTKIPEIFFPIANRDFKKSEREAHLQLTINLYRKKKWGLMYKSVKLFQQKYGAKAEWEMIEFVKANAILRENVDTPNPELFKTAIAMLSNLSEKTDNYELKKAIYKYLLTHYMEKGETLKVLQLAKSYYAGTRDNFDFEESIIPAEAMFNSLAKLGQVDKIKELSEEKTIKKILPAQLLIAYQSFANLRAGDVNGVVKLYESKKASMAKPIDPVIMYNTAEAYFRLGRFQEAQALYQDFIRNYSYEFVASNAHLRAALCSDLMDKNYNETLELYKKAIDSSIDGLVSYEARVRYVAFRSVRKKVLDERDLEIRIFLEKDKNANDADKNLSKLLQQVRLRTLIVDGKYKEALAYLSLIPTIGMAKIDARIFEGDGAEIVYGIISDFYKKSEYSQVIKAWQTYKDKYVDKVAMDPYINFVVGSSFVKLGLYKGFDDVYAAFEKLKDTPNRTFPVWIDRNMGLKASDLLNELVIVKDIKLRSWDLVEKNITTFEKKLPNYNKTNYYKGLVAFNQKNYTGAISHLENFFSKQDQRIIYDPSDVADMIRAYTDSIYELGQTDKFLKVSEAILSDTTTFGTDNAYIQNVRERIAYLGIEITSGKGNTVNFMLFEKKINDFKKIYPKSIYTGRVNYILGQSMVANQKVKEGREIFTTLINDKGTSDYLRELAKSELGLLNLKERTL